MNYKKTLTLLLVLTLIITFVGYFLSTPEKIGLCKNGDLDCIYSYDPFIQLFWLFPLIPIFLILLFTREEVFNVWKRFAQIFLPIGIILIALTPLDCSGSLGICLDREISFWWISVIYLSVSLLIIIFKSIKLRKAQSTSQPVNK